MAASPYHRTLGARRHRQSVYDAKARTLAPRKSRRRSRTGNNRARTPGWRLKSRAFRLHSRRSRGSKSCEGIDGPSVARWAATRTIFPSTSANEASLWPSSSIDGIFFPFFMRWYPMLQTTYPFKPVSAGSSDGKPQPGRCTVGRLGSISPAGPWSWRLSGKRTTGPIPSEKLAVRLEVETRQRRDDTPSRSAGLWRLFMARIENVGGGRHGATFPLRGCSY